MITRARIWLVVALPVALVLQNAFGAIAIRSRSGQFLVHSPHGTSTSLGQVPAREQPRLLLVEPDPLVISCERIKAAVLNELGAPDRWQGVVHLWIRPDANPGMPLRVVSTRFTDGWRYSVELPGQIAPAALVQVIVEVLLIEIANRYNGSYAPEVPIWLVIGLSAKLIAGTGPDLVPASSALISKVGDSWGQLQGVSRYQSPGAARQALRTRMRAGRPLGFEELSLPALDVLTNERIDYYRSCAHLFVSELIELPDGRRKLWTMLAQARQVLNWQTAFLMAYRSTFDRLLDVEKWWALRVAKFLDSDELNSWPVELSLERLADVVHVEVEVRSSAAAQPQRAAITLDRALREWPWVAHAPMVKMKIGQLRMLRLGVAREVMPLVSEYQSALEYYIRRGNDLTAKAAKGRSIAALSSLTRNTAALLRDLDSKRLRFKPAAEREVVRTSDDSGGGKPAASPRD